MTTKTKILIGILIVIVLVGSGWWIWNVELKKINCSEITSVHWGKLCAGQEVVAVGVLECYSEQAPKGGVHYLKFENGTELKFFDKIPDCEKYQHQKIEVMGDLYKCGGLNQCAGIGLRNIKSVSPIPGKVAVTTDKSEYKEGEVMKIKVENNSNENICFGSCNSYYLGKKTWVGAWKNFDMECFVNFITNCIEPGQIKIFEEAINKSTEFAKGKGVYRVTAPIWWNGCESLEKEGHKYINCKAVTEIHSDEFKLK